MGRNYSGYPRGIVFEESGPGPLKFRLEMNAEEFEAAFKPNEFKVRNRMRPTFGEHIIIDEYGYTGNFTSSKHISSFIYPKDHTAALADKIVYSFINDNETYFNDNLLSVLHEDPEELEFGGYNPLCDTAVYYFILDFEEYDADLVEDSDDEEYIFIDEEELDFTGGFDFFEHCATIGVKLPQFDEALITYKG